MYCVPIHANIKCVSINVIYMVELKYRVLAPWGPSSISAVAELVFICNRETSFFEKLEIEDRGTAPTY